MGSGTRETGDFLRPPYSYSPVYTRCTWAKVVGSPLGYCLAKPSPLKNQQTTVGTSQIVSVKSFSVNYNRKIHRRSSKKRGKCQELSLSHRDNNTLRRNPAQHPR